MARVSNVDEVIRRLSSGGSMRCNEVIGLLKGLGFSVRNGAKVGHKVITHAGLGNFTSSAFTCGHGRNPEIKPVYVNRLRKLLEEYADDLRPNENAPTPTNPTRGGHDNESTNQSVRLQRNGASD